MLGHKQSLMAISLLIAASVFFGLGSKASATLEGDNGRILYAENDPDQSCVFDDGTDAQNNVVTTAPDGSDQKTAATTPNCVTAATVSAPTTNDTNKIVYATTDPACPEPTVDEQTIDGPWLPFDNCFIPSPGVSLNKVEIDQSGNPVTPVTQVYSKQPESIYPEFHSIDKLSFSPTGDHVVATAFDLVLPISFTGSIENIDITNGSVDTLYSTGFDPFLSAGYGQNGNIYYSRNTPSTYTEGSEEEWIWESNSEIWYVPAGGHSENATRLTFSNDLNEFFLSASPDNSKLLVCDAITGLFYFVNTADGNATQLADLANGFYPVAFSPDGKLLLGDLNQGNEFNYCNGFGIELRTAAFSAFANIQVQALSSGVAVAALTALNDPAVINQTLKGVVDWAPAIPAKTIAQTPTAGRGAGSVTTSTVLQNTGSGVLLNLAVGMSTTTGAGATVASRRRKSVRK